MRKSDGRVARLNLDGGYLLIYIDGHGVVVHFRRDAHVAQNFPGKNPGFERPILLPQKGSTRAGYSEWPGSDRILANAELTGLSGWELLKRTKLSCSA